VVVLEDNAAAFPITLDLIEQRLVAAEARQRRAEEEAAGGVFWAGRHQGGNGGRVGQQWQGGRQGSKTYATSETRGEATGVVVVNSKGMLVSSNSRKGKSSQLLVEAMGMGVME
jgi:hypothetical protein